MVSVLYVKMDHGKTGFVNNNTMSIEQAKDILVSLQQNVSLSGKEHDAVKVAIATLYEAAKVNQSEKTK